ncbi:MAG: HDOD domain-containing protein [Chromatiaceae bacterium]|nr:HDOD domain-containing protein [Chromatiaceae bacterium]MCP5312462.1 HDOD domain-containing protein [Chromatiaceae bacterium]
MPPEAEHTLSESAGGAVEFLLRRMQRNQDFPALSETIRTLNGLSASSNKSIEQLASVIVRDYALTNKVLKVVNSAFYAGFAGKVGTISRAIVVLGIEPIRALAASLMLFEHLSEASNADRVKALIGKSMFGALLAREAASDVGLPQGEEAFLAAMFHNLGELLVAFYLAEEDAAIQEMVADGEVAPLRAQHEVLGVSFEQLGMAVGRHWNFPDLITNSMKRMPPGQLSKAKNDDELLCRLAGFASEVTERLAVGDRSGDPLMDAVLSRYQKCVKLEAASFDDAVSEARSEYRMLAESLATPERAPGAIRALAGLKPPEQAADAVDEDFADVALPEDQSTQADRVVEPEPILVEGLQEATAMLSEGAGLNQVAQVMLETLYRAFGLRRVALCLRDVSRRQYVGRLGFGGDIEGYLNALRFGEAYERDVFHVALKQKTDVHIADLAVGGAGHGIPAWYSAISPSGALLFLPLLVHERPVGCIIAEHEQANGLRLEPGALRLVRALRNQLSLGLQLRRSSGG